MAVEVRIPTVFRKFTNNDATASVNEGTIGELIDQLGERYPGCAFGAGGGGSARYLGLGGPNVVICASLAKGFGVPIAVLGAADALIRRFECTAETRVHCSQPSTAALRAAERALDLNEIAGDAQRSRLMALIMRFRDRVAGAG